MISCYYNDILFLLNYEDKFLNVVNKFVYVFCAICVRTVSSAPIVRPKIH